MGRPAKKQLYKALHEQGLSMAEIARIMGVSRQAVHCVLRTSYKKYLPCKDILQRLRVGDSTTIPGSCSQALIHYHSRKLGIKVMTRTISWESGDMWVCRIE